MKTFAKKALDTALAAVDGVPTRKTSSEALRKLIDRLKPRQSAQELIRVGPAGDGGYLVPDDLEGISACYSPGVNLISDFEKDCADRGMRVYMADASVDGPATEHSNFDFRKMFVGATTDDVFMTVDDWVAETSGDSTSDLILQMDIEGFEYEVLLAMSMDLLKRFRIIVVEFHMLEQLWNKPFFGLASRAIEKLCSTHDCVHLHPNNCGGIVTRDGISIPRVMEFTFVRKDRMPEEPIFAKHFPHPLDEDNTGENPTVLPATWIG